MSPAEIGLQLKQRRNTLNITQPDLAELAQINLNTIYRIERGQANPTLNTLIKIADVLGLELKVDIKRPHTHL